MSLKLMFITNKPEIALIAEKSGVDRIFVDMEYIGKDERQAGLDTVKSHHTIADIISIKNVITKAELLVRINPIHLQNSEYLGTKREIEEAISAGAELLMLPMFKTVEEVKTFIDIVKNRAKKVLLLETAEAVECIDEILEIDGIDEIHIGLNDLHLALNKKFMFELLADGTVEYLCNKIKNKKIAYGFGGIARLGYGILPAEYIITEHYRLKSSMAILSRSFCDANNVENPKNLESMFIDGVKNIREFEKEVMYLDLEKFEINKETVIKKVNEIIGTM